MLVTVVGTNPVEKSAGNVRHHETYLLVGLVGKASASRATDLGSSPAFPVGLFLGQVIPVAEILVLQ